MRTLLILLTTLFSALSWANAEKSYEALLLKSSIHLNESLATAKNCLFCDDENYAAGKQNFLFTLLDISKRANSCKNGDSSETETFAWSMEMVADEDYPSTTFDIKEKLSQHFNDFSIAQVSCENMARVFLAEEISQGNKKINFAESSIQILEVSRFNKANVHSKLQEICQPIVELTACLVDNSYTGRLLLNDLRKSEGKRKLGRLVPCRNNIQ
ncbi:hypothetical protein [Vibrio paucivorans]|uniref:Uncharacterized protein n=1 Tax=Vibrio paucivorans TaxID=2829489 RepID=A0A9X3CAX8_9VIBR|nr:hypothetical protein [Vibrio paucivorans]MCW8332329.1 hypothetical protein [Vibrio paucivorans]